MTEAEEKVVSAVIDGLRKEGFAIVDLNLIGRINDYFRLNTKPENDLAQSYMLALDQIIGPPTIPLYGAESPPIPAQNKGDCQP